MFRVKVRIDTMKDCQEFVNITSSIKENVVLTNNSGSFRVNAKSLFGVVYSIEWNNIYCECEKDIYRKIEKFVIES